MAIDVGPACSDRVTFLGSQTVVNKGNPANETGKINYICIYAVTLMTGIEVASFSAAGNNLTTNASVSLANAAIGKNEYNAPGDFVAFDINAGEYLGIYFTGGTIEYDNAGFDDIWTRAGDNIPCVGAAFVLNAGDAVSLYGEGSGWSAGKILGVDAGNMAKVDAILKANVGKIIGV